MSKVTLNNPATFTNDTSAVSIISANNAAVEAGFDNTLSRDGTSPNQMAANLDMNSNRILNLPTPTSSFEPARLYEVDNLTAVAASSFVADSTTSATIGTGTQSFTIENGKYFAVGQFVIIASKSNPTNYMHGQVTSLVGTALTVDVLDTGGSGVHSDWTVSMSGTGASTGRYQLKTSVTVNISTTGSDSIDWINNQSSAFATMSGAYTYFAHNVDLAGNTVTFQVAAGTYGDSMQAYGPLVGQQGAGAVIFKGDSTTPTNVVITPAGTHAGGYGFGAFFGAMFTIDGFTISMDPAHCQDMVSVGEGAVIVYQNINFEYNRAPFNHISCALGGALQNGGSNYITASSISTNLTTTNGSTTATVASATNIYTNLGVDCTSVPAGTYITAVNGTTITLSKAATATGTNSSNFWSSAQCHILIGQNSWYYDLASGALDGQIIGVTGKPMFTDGFINNNGGQMIFQYVGILSNYVSKQSTLTASSANITVSDTTGLTVGMQAVSSAIQWGSTISSISGTTVTLTGGTATTTASNIKVWFGNTPTLGGTPLVNAGAGYVNFATDILTSSGKVYANYIPSTDMVKTSGTNITAGYPSITVSSAEATAISNLFSYFPGGKGLMVFGPGIPVGATIPDSSYVQGTSIYLDHPTYANESGVSLTVGGFQWNGAQYIVYNDKPTSFGALPVAPTIVNSSIQGGTFQNQDSNVTLWATSDRTKQLQFSAASISTNTTRTLTAPDANTTIVGTDASQTLTNKTITGPVISGGTYATADSNWDLWSAADGSKTFKFSASAISPSTSRTLTVPDANTTIVGTDVAQTLTNKTLTNPIISNILGAGGTGGVSIQGIPSATAPSAGYKGEIIQSSMANAAQATVTVTIASPGVVTWTSHPYTASGAAFRFTTTGSLPTGLSAGTNYYIIYVDANTFKLATSVANALAGTAINTSGTQSGTHTGFNTATLTTATTCDLNGISLTAGGWYVFSSISYTGDSTTTTNIVVADMGTTSGALQQVPTKFGKQNWNGSTTYSGSGGFTIDCGPGVFQFNSTTNLYLKTFVTFGTSTTAPCGGLVAIRIY